MQFKSVLNFLVRCRARKILHLNRSIYTAIEGTYTHRKLALSVKETCRRFRIFRILILEHLSVDKRFYTVRRYFQESFHAFVQRKRIALAHQRQCAIFVCVVHTVHIGKSTQLQLSLKNRIVEIITRKAHDLRGNFIIFPIAHHKQQRICSVGDRNARRKRLVARHGDRHFRIENEIFVRHCLRKEINLSQPSS